MTKQKPKKHAANDAAAAAATEVKPVDVEGTGDVAQTSSLARQRSDSCEYVPADALDEHPADALADDFADAGFAPRLRRRSSVEEEVSLFEMDGDSSSTVVHAPQPQVATSSSVLDSAVLDEADEDDDDVEGTDTTTPIAIARADSPHEEDLESALLNAASAPRATSYGVARPPSSGVSVGDFDLLSVVGRGAYGKVFLVRRRATGRHYAMKVIRKADAIQKNVAVNTRAERDVLQAVRHPFIVNLRFAFQSETKLYLCLDFIGGGELFNRLSASRDHSLPLSHCRFYAAEIVLALEHLHSLQIIYRDLKPENILLCTGGHVCLTDFGFAKEHISANDEGSRSFVGTLHYMSPEQIEYRGHGKGSDWWSLGAVLHEMITGTTPFNGNNRKAIQDNILKAPLKLPRYLDAPTKSILTELLRRPIHKRLGCGPDGVAAIKKHPFFMGINWTALAKKQVTPPFVPQIAHAEDTSHFDAKFTGERVVDTPLSPSQMAQILSGNGISPQTFHDTHNAAFVGFSYHRDHTPGPSPALRAAHAPGHLHAALAGAGSGLASPRTPATGLPPLHHPTPDTLELPPGARPPATTTSSASASDAQSRVLLEMPVTVLASTRAANQAGLTNTVQVPTPTTATSQIAPPAGADASTASVAATPSHPQPQQSTPSKLSKQLADRKKQGRGGDAPSSQPAQAHDKAQNVTATNVPSTASTAAPSSAGITITHAPAAAPAPKGLSAAAPAFVPGGGGGAPSTSRAKNHGRPTSGAPVAFAQPAPTPAISTPIMAVPAAQPRSRGGRPTSARPSHQRDHTNGHGTRNDANAAASAAHVAAAAAAATTSFHSAAVATAAIAHTHAISSVVAAATASAAQAATSAAAYAAATSFASTAAAPALPTARKVGWPGAGGNGADRHHHQPPARSVIGFAAPPPAAAPVAARSALPTAQRIPHPGAVDGAPVMSTPLGSARWAVKAAANARNAAAPTSAHATSPQPMPANDFPALGGGSGAVPTAAIPMPTATSWGRR